MRHLFRKGGAFVAVVMIASLLSAVLAGPAAAAEMGAGVVANGVWDDTTMASTHPNCGGKVTSTNANWTEAGTFTRGNGAVVAEVVTEVDLTSNGAYYFDPFGTHNLNDCSDPVGADISATVDVSTVTGNGTVTCNNLSGTFDRTNVTVVTVTASGNCSINGTTQAVTVNWILDVVGFPDPLGVGLPPSQIVGGTYSET